MTSTRIGVLVPAGNTIHEREFDALRAATGCNVEFAFRPFDYPAAGVADFCSALIAQFAVPLRELRAWGAEVVLVGCTAASMRCATPAHDAALAELAGAPVVTAARATREALAALALERIVVATPYGAASNRIVRDFLESLDVRVVAIEGLGYDADPALWKTEVPRVDGERGCEFAQQIEARAGAANIQGAYFPCTGMASIDAIARYESRTGRSGVSSVLAGFWAALGRAGIDIRQSDIRHSDSRQPDSRSGPRRDAQPHLFARPFRAT